jgi:hypothetical protein
VTNFVGMRTRNGFFDLRQDATKRTRNHAATEIRI